MIFTIKLNEDEIKAVEIALISKISKEEKTYNKDLKNNNSYVLSSYQKVNDYKELLKKLENFYIMDKRGKKND